MKKKWTLTISFTVAVGLALMAGGCSSSSVKEDGTGDEVAEGAPAPDAGTDSVPPPEQASAEQPAPAEGEAVAAGEPPPPVDQVPTEQAPEGQVPPAEGEPLAAAPVQEEATPSGIEAASPMGASSGEFETYSVQTGDTLMKIAFETYGDLYQWRRVYDLNRDKISSPNSLPRGLQLKLEKPSNPVAIDKNGERYLIKVGDTLGSISGDVYGTAKKWKKLWENNRQLIRDPNKIYAGFFLFYTMDGEKMPPPLARAKPASVETARAPASVPAATATQ